MHMYFHVFTMYYIDLRMVENISHNREREASTATRGVIISTASLNPSLENPATHRDKEGKRVHSYMNLCIKHSMYIYMYIYSIGYTLGSQCIPGIYPRWFPITHEDIISNHRGDFPVYMGYLDKSNL